MASPISVIVIPFGTNAPKLCPADPVNRMLIVPSGRPAPFQTLVTSWPSSVPTVRLTLRIGRSIVDLLGRRRSPARASRISSWSSASSSP